MGLKSWWRLAALLAVFALVAAACDSGGDSSDDGGDSATSDDVEIPEGPPVSGDPFKVGIVTSEGVPGIDLPDVANGGEAATEYVNKELGGIGGRPLEAVVCNAMADPTGNAECAQEFVDEGVLAVAGLDPAWGDNGLPITAAADITWIGQPTVFSEFIGDGSYPLAGGSLTAFPAQAKYFGETVGVESASIIYADLAAGETAANELLGKPLESYGVEVNYVPEAVGAADFTAAVTKANDNDPDVIFILMAAADCARILQAAEQGGVEAQMAASGACADENAIEVAGESAVEGLVFNSGTHNLAQEGEPEFEDSEIFNDRIVRYADQEPTGFAASTFSQVVTLADIANQVGDEQGVDAVDAATVQAAITSAVGQPVFMATELDSTNPAALAGVETNVFILPQRIYQYTDGELVDLAGEWVNGFE